MRRAQANTPPGGPHRRYSQARLTPWLTLAVALAWSPPAAAEIGYAIHAEGAAARMVGERKTDQFGWGGSGVLAPELTLGARIGFELPVGGLVLSDGAVDEPGYQQTAQGFSLFLLPGVRVRPFGRSGLQALEPGGLWIAAGGGMAQTGELTRPAIDARLGYDFFAGNTMRVGPSGGWLQIIETESTLRPEDARMLLVGVHGAFEPQRKQPTAAAVDEDRDDDGIPNARDRCPDDPEDFDAFEDADGCPEPDNDLDGILDDLDHCPDQAEDFDAFKDTDGCPDPDNDDDGILDKPDKCPNQAEDIDGFDDDDGCPDIDNDKDGIADMPDKCPNDPETFNGYADDDGCPDEDKVRVVGNEILLDERVHFRTNMAEIYPRSWRLMQNVATLLKAHPQYKLVRVQGHADDTGAHDYNQQLSKRRSASVRDMLVSFGVDEKRLVVEGFGDSRPRVQAHSVSARRANRRVEFLILEREAVHAAPPRSAAEILRDAGEQP